MAHTSSLLSGNTALYEGSATPFVTSPAATPARRYPAISATILTKNSAARLDEVLSALRWCREVIVLDTGSTDDTIEIAQRHSHVRVHRLAGPFPGFGRAHRRAVELASHDWILSIDSDEIVTPALVAEITALELDPHTVYTIPFENYFNGRKITSCGWAPDRHERLFNRTVTNFCASEVHERVQTGSLSVRILQYSIRHHSYDTLEDFLRKMNSYGRLFAAQHAGRKPSSPIKAVAHGTWAFVKSYFFQLGCAEGYEGLVISAYKAQTVFWKYLFLHEANQRRP